MKLTEALQLKPDYVVRCPEDRGDVAHVARVRSVSTDVQKNFKGVEFVWVTVKGEKRYGGRGGAVWPSNRLG